MVACSQSMENKLNMKLSRLLFTALLSLGCLQFSYAQITVTVKGKVKGDTEGHNMLYIGNQLSTDSTTIENGKYELTFTEDKPGFRAISLNYDRAKMRMYVPLVLFFDQSGTINVDFDIEKGLSSANISGLESASTHYNFRKASAGFFPEVRAKVIDRFGESAYDDKNDHFKDAIFYQKELLATKIDQLISSMLKPDALVTANIILSQADALGGEYLEKHYNMLTPEVQQSEEGRKIKAKIEGAKNAHIGAVVKGFTLPNEKGEAVDFDDYRGKYVMVDFWASWCSPCRASFPRVREVYSQLQGAGKDFEIVNISIDQNKEAWEKAVEQEGNPWPQLYDDAHISYSQFDVKAIPTIYLIDPEGKIVLREVGFDPKGGGSMEKKLEEIFNIKFK